MNWTIKRSYGLKETIGEGQLLNGTNVLAIFRTIELPNLNNQHDISCIPEGNYTVTKDNNPHFGNFFRVQNVPGRDGICIHSGAYVTDVLGCIITGLDMVDFNGDGVLDISYARNVVDYLWGISPQSFTLKIYS